jgi:hypothetical protein
MPCLCCVVLFLVAPQPTRQSKKRKAQGQPDGRSNLGEKKQRVSGTTEVKKLPDSGLKNFSGTACHLNSILQCLKHIDTLRVPLTGDEKHAIGPLLAQMAQGGGRALSAEPVMKDITGVSLGYSGKQQHPETER